LLKGSMSENDPWETARLVEGAAGNRVPADEPRTGEVAGEVSELKDVQQAAPVAPVDAAPPGSEAASLAESDNSDAQAPHKLPAASFGSEIELKLLVDADRLADFADAPAIVAHARTNGIRKRLKSVYYDTPRQILRQNGLSLRVRQSGQRFVQTVKSEATDDPLRRGEWEASVPSIAPDVGLAMPFVPTKLREELRTEPLRPMFIAEVRRHQRVLDMAAGTIEVAFDQGTLRAGERSLPISEIELELKSGDASAIYELALALVDYGPVRPSVRSKAARGFDLAADTPPPAKAIRRLDVDPTLPLDRAFGAILASCLRDLLIAMPAADDGRDPEGVHQVRVALRRLRSALGSMRTVVTSPTLDGLREDAKWLASSLSAARSWDIFKIETLPTVAKSCPSVSGFDALSEGASERVAAAYADARRALGDERSARFVLQLGAWIAARGWHRDAGPESLPLLAEPASGFAGRVLSIHHTRVLKRGRHFKSLTPQRRHRLRLAVKSLRYVADFLLPLCTDRKSARDYTLRLAEFQDELGAFNDMTTTGSLLDNLTTTKQEGSTAAAAILGWQAHAMVDAEERLRKSWRRFAKVSPPWIPVIGG
jgi:triphosphatase